MSKILKLLLFLSLFLSLSSCSKDEGNNNGNGNTEISVLKPGNAIVLSKRSPMGFGYFKVTGLAEGQWNNVETAYINPNNSTATFTYTNIGEHMYRLESLNRQIISSGPRYWYIILDLTFTSRREGSYKLVDTNNTTGVSYTTYGTFIIK